jgi:hypothetical protein
VDRLTTGRRHARAGSVTVTELLTKQVSPPHRTDSSLTELKDLTDLTAVTDTIPVVPVTHRRSPTKTGQFAKLASLGVATAMLCGAVTVASMITHQRRDTTQSGARPTVRITGEQALLPDRLDRTSATAPAPADPPVLGPHPVPTEQSDPVTSKDADDSTTTSSSAAARPDAASDLELVREFYENLPDAPTTAFTLLSADLLNTSLGDFLASWSTVRSIDQLDIVQQADGVLATVRLRLADGGHLRVQQLLTVAESPRRIVGVQLLSTQRG